MCVYLSLPFFLSPSLFAAGLCFLMLLFVAAFAPNDASSLAGVDVASTIASCDAAIFGNADLDASHGAGDTNVDVVDGAFPTSVQN